MALPGTPLIAGEEKTRDVFGDYVSIYDFQQSVEDGATVPLFYENRTPELQLVNPDPVLLIDNPASVVTGHLKTSHSGSIQNQPP